MNPVAFPQGLNYIHCFTEACIGYVQTADEMLDEDCSHIYHMPNALVAGLPARMAQDRGEELAEVCSLAGARGDLQSCKGQEWQYHYPVAIAAGVHTVQKRR